MRHRSAPPVAMVPSANVLYLIFYHRGGGDTEGTEKLRLPLPNFESMFLLK